MKASFEGSRKSVATVQNKPAQSAERADTQTREPKRDWALGPVTGHRVSVVLCMALGVFLLYQIQEFLWPEGQSAHGWLEQSWSYGALLWLGAVIPGAAGLVGMVAFRHAERLDEVPAIPYFVCWRIVSRGENVEALTSTIRRCQDEMARTPLFRYVIEVVTDHVSTKLPPPNDDLAYLAVPPDYRTPNGSLYKARALHYALEHSALPNTAWVVHLDEETQPTSSGIKGIARMIDEEEKSGALRIGQGAILYHRDWHTHPFLTLADNVRTGDDFARFHFQHRLHRTVFGMHGSYIVVRNDVEKTSGFDFGPVGSITEDAFWALVCMERGHRCRWVDGYLEEQSTQSFGDFVRQRRRWFQGLAKVSLFAPVKPRWRISLGANTAMWALAPFAMLYTLGHLVYGFEVEPWVRALANGSFVSFVTLYVMGLRSNFAERGITGWRKAGWGAAQIVLVPVFSAMEAAGVLMALLKPVAGFHVIRK